MAPRNAILLLRISDDKSGDSKGVALQEVNGRAYADKIGWGIGRVIIENDTSAFKRKRVRLPNGRIELRTVRPGFREALDLLATGSNDGLLAIDLDRAARDPRDLEDLIDVVEDATPRIPVESVTGSLRLANDADITMARVMVAIANKASRDTRRRISDRQEQLALEGKPKGGGFRAYGYERDGLTVVEHEADVINWMADRILDEDEYWSLGRIAADLTARRIPTATGLTTWAARTVSSILTGPRLAGHRVYKKTIVGPAVWPAILKDGRWEAVCAELAGRDHGLRSNQLKRWLTGVLVCGRPGCGAKLMGVHGYGGRGHRYWCQPSRGGCGKIAISGPHAEDEVARQVVEALADPAVMGRLRRAQETVDAARVRADLADDEAQLKELARMWGSKEIDSAEYKTARLPIKERLERGRGLLMSSTPAPVRQMLQAEDPAAQWKGYGPADKREIVLALVAGYLVVPHPPGRVRRFDPDRLVPIPHAS